ncbi:MAG TPA: hypothetical protein VKU83_06440 [Puia sp.]|nr:hypothetical protein [Puia sp.]
MKYVNPTVLEPDQVESGKSYYVGELPAGIPFQLGRGRFETVTYPPYKVVSRNCAGGKAEVWNTRAGKLHKVAYRQRVKALTRA